MSTEIIIGSEKVKISGKDTKHTLLVGFDATNPADLKITNVYASENLFNNPNVTGNTPAEIADDIIKKNTTMTFKTDSVRFGGKPKRKSSKNRRKSKGGRKPKRKSSKNRK
tara:strand:+ start:2603 stop:2935 length:333 start_codon:yes stop_codon:yes gene_type:complete